MLNTTIILNEKKKNLITRKTNFKNFKKIIWNHALYYPTPINLNYFWSFGSLATLAIVIQLLTGIFLAMYYVPKDAHAFHSVENIMREINFGWLIRYLHSNGASFFFIVVYLHIGRGLYYRSYEGRSQLWFTGLLLFLLMMAAAFMGYVLPWGQMSFWGTMVITNLFSAVPVFGATLVTWLWGDFSVTDVTLNRFFSLHYLISMTIASIIITHIIVLHDTGSSSPIYAECAPHFTKLKFQPFFITKDIIGIIYFFVFLLYFIVLIPNFLGHSDNYIEANPFTTPEHIVPEWYFLPFYATLRSIPNKLQGIIYMVLVIFSIGLLPIIDRTRIVNITTKPIYNITFWLWVSSFIFLGWLGAKPLEEPYISLHQPAVFLYFSFYLLNWLVIQIIEQEILDYKKKNVKT